MSWGGPGGRPPAAGRGRPAAARRRAGGLGGVRPHAGRRMVLMPGALPDGEPVPADGSLPAAAVDAAGKHGFGVYVHVPFCASRCGYCDFNTYTAAELPGIRRDGYADVVLAELALARRVLGRPVPVGTVFFGGGTPTLLPPDDLARILAGIDDIFG